MLSRLPLFALVVTSMVLPIAVAVLMAVARLLSTLGDQIGAQVLDRIALAGGILWVIDLACLITVQGILWLATENRNPPGNDSKRLD